MSIISQKIKLSFKNDKRGMTLIELLVVMAIITILSAITIFDYNSFRSAVSTQNLANDIALSIRKAQSYAIGVKGSSSIFSDGYGISFVVDETPINKISGSSKSFVIFKDIEDVSNNDNHGLGQYNFPQGPSVDTCGTPGIISGVINECQETLTIPGADKIKTILYLKNGDTTSTDAGVGRVDIVFKRPNPDALFCHRKDYGSNCKPLLSKSPYFEIKVSNGLASPKEITRTISVWNTGQISVSSQ